MHYVEIQELTNQHILGLQQQLIADIIPQFTGIIRLGAIISHLSAHIAGKLGPKAAHLSVVIISLERFIN